MFVVTLAVAATSLAATRTIGLTPCHPGKIEEAVLCGTLHVPENRAKPDGKSIALAMIVMPALAQPAAEPLFDLAGGPGLAATSGAAIYATDLRPYRAHRDVVLVDQRGTGGADRLACTMKGTPVQQFTGETFPLDYVQQCRRDLESRGHDLSAYTTDASAEDLDAVRAALGYERIALTGLSYGSRLALVYARRHPDRVARMILTGTTPAWASLPLFHASSAQRGLDLVFDDCAADEKCSAKYGDVRAKLQRVLATLAAKPEPAPPEIFAERLRTLLYMPATSRRLPKIIDSASRGDFAPFLALASDGMAYADGLYLSVTCSEDVPRIAESDVKRSAAGTYFGDYRIRQQQRACRNWPAAKLDPAFWDDVQADVPTLILAGYRDPVTPPTWSYAVASHLPHARVVLIPQSAHLPDGLSNFECWDGLSMKFLDGAELTDADVACVKNMSPSPFD